MTNLEKALIGRQFKANHPITVLNPEEVFTIHQVQVETFIEGHVKIYVCGENTCWFNFITGGKLL